MSSNSISLHQIGKRYNHEWIFRNLNFEFREDEPTVILGANGSGKSTLLQLILGSSIPSEGTINLTIDGQALSHEECVGKTSIAAPYLELIEEFTLVEMLEFHGKMMPFIPGLKLDVILEKMYLTDSKNKAIKYFSSGMKQRVKLGLALFSDTPVVLLDEPASNLDSNAVAWYQQMVVENGEDRIIIVCSNDQKDEFSFCKNSLNIADFC